jgi:hypothetical protein
MKLREDQLDLGPVVVGEPDPLPVVIMIPVNHNLRCAVMFSHLMLFLMNTLDDTISFKPQRFLR